MSSLQVPVGTGSIYYAAIRGKTIYIDQFWTSIRDYCRGLETIDHVVFNDHLLWKPYQDFGMLNYRKGYDLVFIFVSESGHVFGLIWLQHKRTYVDCVQINTAKSLQGKWGVGRMLLWIAQRYSQVNDLLLILKTNSEPISSILQKMGMSCQMHNPGTLEIVPGAKSIHKPSVCCLLLTYLY